MAAENPRETLFEFVAIGSAVKVSAIDAETGVEVVVMGPANATQDQLEQLALRKLQARIARSAPK